MCLVSCPMRLRRLHILPWYLKEKQLAQAPLNSRSESLRYDSFFFIHGTKSELNYAVQDTYAAHTCYRFL